MLGDLKRVEGRVLWFKKAILPRWKCGNVLSPPDLVNPGRLHHLARCRLPEATMDVDLIQSGVACRVKYDAMIGSASDIQEQGQSRCDEGSERDG